MSRFTLNRNSSLVARVFSGLTLGALFCGLAAPPTKTTIHTRLAQALSSHGSMKEFYTALTKEYGPSVVAPLLQIAEDKTERDEFRWASLFGVAKIAGKDSLGVIRQFLSDSSWMLRDAALKTAAALEARELESEIVARLQDDALVVRTTAVDTIGHLKLKQDAPQLVSALFDPANYNRGQPLWIHRHILGVIKDFHYQAAVPKLVELLSVKSEPQFQTEIVDTLESLTGKSFANKPMREQVYLWKRNTVSDMTF